MKIKGEIEKPSDSVIVIYIHCVKRLFLFHLDVQYKHNVFFLFVCTVNVMHIRVIWIIG